jgi:hypothetical protein
METWLMSLGLGLALSASSGFRIFVPLLVSNLATKLGLVSVSPDFQFMGSHTATLVLAVACIVEIGSYYVTYIDNFLDTLAVPASVVAGTLLTTQFLQIDEPVLKWGLGLIAGGGMAGTVQSGTSLLRLASTKFTGGLGNGFLSTAENIMAVVVSVISFWIPIIMGIISLFLVYFLLKKLFNKNKKKLSNTF